MQKYSYHTHTNFSDGRNSVEEMLAEAVKLGLTEIGISDHLTLHENFASSPSWPTLQSYYGAHIYRTDFKKAISEFQQHADYVRKIAKNYPLKVYVGAEVDFFTYDGWLDAFKNFQNQTNLDYYLSGNHFLFSEDCAYPLDPDTLSVMVPDIEEQKEYICRHFKTIGKAVESGLFNFVAHIDYMRRVPVCNDTDLMSEKNALLALLAKYNFPAEVSTKGIRKNGYCYPAPDLLQKMRDLNIPVVISDDAHKVEELTKDFMVAETLLHELHYTNYWKLIKY